MNILIAEDESQKLQDLEEFVSSRFSSLQMFTAKSVRSAIDAIVETEPQFILLDMSLPTFDIAPGEPGGRPQGFGGIEVMRYMGALGAKGAVIVVTQYAGFEDQGRNVDLSSLADELYEAHPAIFRGIVYYSALNSEWCASLETLLRDLTGTK